ncbi:MAG: L-2-amino-thiazoline-4-carboxylic acid hydrolase [Candidatus Aminicenantes bacterium]|nr:L-2-amino-thiazoline-4-carboxylic acid hydrolase [Candidatus Aminicenantes bacterium]
MKQPSWTQTCRRDFLTKALPICAFSCLGASKIFAKSPFIAKSLLEEEKHKFDKELPGPKLTYRRMAAFQNRSFIQFARFLQKEIGEEKVIELIKKQTDERLLQQAKNDLKRLGKSDFKSYISIFRDPRMEASLNMEIIQDTDTVFEIKVTDCLAAESFLPHKAGDIGYAAVCWGDYIWAEGFNPKIKLIRDKTLMQGDDYCNHKYIWTG